MPNRLADEQSRYLLQHAQNPVDWYPWGEAAFEASRSQGKPILVSIGYSSCHWCHVMAHESFEDEETARVVNELFIPIKVDKEEYPDVDGYYMSFLTQLSGNGGWPLNVLLNSYRAPFYGFTYLPADSLRSTLTYARGEYDRLERIRDQRINTGFSQHPVDCDHVASAVEGLHFKTPTSSQGPQFPQALYLLLAEESGNHELVRRELNTLITKGLFDHVEGGWFRYSVDPEWKIPHFEKMLYDQAALLLVCAEAHHLAPDLCSYAISKTIAWLSDHMRLPNGLYGSATDADTSDGEGTYYTFPGIESQREVELFRLTECGRHEGRYHPWIDLKTYRRDPAAAESIITARREARAELEAPGLDTKAVFSWNAFLGYALYHCADALGDETIRVVADGLAESLGRVADVQIRHAIYSETESRGNQYLQDYASYLLLLSAIPETTEPLGRRRAAIVEAIRERFVDSERIWHTDERMFESQSLWQDTPFPAGGSMLINALARSDEESTDLADLLLTNIVDVGVEHPVFFAFWLRGFKRYLRDAR